MMGWTRFLPKGAQVIQSVVSTQARHPHPAFSHRRIGERRKLQVAGRLTWRDASGALRFVSVVTRDVSDVDAFVECQVHFQIERNGRDMTDLPPVLQQGKVLSAVYRVGPYRTATGTPQGYALRLLIDPAASSVTVRNRPRLASAN